MPESIEQRLADLKKQTSDTESLVYSMMELDGQQIKELSERIKKLEGEITAIPFYAQKIADLEADNKRLSGLVDELMLAMERARIPRYPH